MKKLLLIRDSHHQSSEYNLRKKLETYKIPFEDIEFQYVLDRHIPQLWQDSNRLLPSPMLEQRFNELKELALSLKPDLILLAGELSLKSLTEERSIFDTHCYVFNSKYGTIIPLLDPKDMYFNPSNGIWIDIALSKAQLLLGNKMVLPDYSGVIKPTLEQVKAFCSSAQNSELLSIDIEKDRHEPHELTTIGLATSTSESISIPLRSYNPSNSYSYWSLEEETHVWQLLRKLFQGTQTKIFHNFIFDCMALWKFDLDMSGPFEDTMNLFHLLHPELKKSLKDSARFYLFVEPWKKDDQWDLKSGNELEHWNYNLKDAQYTLELYKNLKEALGEDKSLERYYEKYSKPMYQEIFRTCKRGVRVNMGRLESMTAELKKQLGPLTGEIIEESAPFLGPGERKKRFRDSEHDVITQMKFEEFERLPPSAQKKYKYMKKAKQVIIPAYRTEVEKFDREFNPSSPLQVKEVLSNMGVQLPVRKGKTSTDENALLKINRKYGLPFIPKLLKYRELSKLISTYCSIVLEEDNRLRYSFNIAGTFGARFSSDKTPWETGCNIQNFPKQFRGVVIPDPNQRLLQVDLSQAELRIVAWLSGDSKLISKLNAGEDLHQHTADVVEQATGIKATRQLGKTINHARNYGCGAPRLADQCLIKCGIPMTVGQADEIIKAHTRMFPDVTRWKRETIRQVQKDRFLVTPTGRKATFYSAWSDKLERQILNFVPQSTVADLINQAWVRLASYPQVDVLQQGHDSLLIQSDRDDIKKCVNVVFEDLELEIRGAKRVIPHDISFGPDWGSL